MNSKDILDALAAARTFKPQEKQPEPIIQAPKDRTSFVSMYDELDSLDTNPFSDRYK